MAVIVVLVLLAMLPATNSEGVAAEGTEDGVGNSSVTTTAAPGPTCEDKCDNGECTDNQTTGQATCVCEGGWAGDTCSKDVNECNTGESNCGSRQFCVNTQGGFSCVCRPGYDGKDCQREVSNVYGGELTFESLEVKNQGWSSDLQEMHSSAFKSLANSVETAISQVLEKKGVPHISVTVVRFTKGTGERSTIVAKFQVTINKPLDPQTIKSALDSGWKRCDEEGVCDFGADGALIYGALKDETMLEDNYDLCDDDRNNVCNDVTTECVTANGTAFCQCRPGFEPWSLYDNSCKDINECEQKGKTRDLCGLSIATCVNTMGSYRCECPNTHAWDDQQASCVWSNICKRDEPCQNDGNCFNIIDKEGERSFVCRCTWWWTGRVCGSVDPEAERVVWILAGVVAGLGVLCIILIIIVIILCCRRKRVKQERRKSSLGNFNFGSSVSTPDTRRNGIAAGNVDSAAAAAAAATTNTSPPSPAHHTPPAVAKTQTSPDSDSNASSDYVVVDAPALSGTNGVFIPTLEKPVKSIYVPPAGGKDAGGKEVRPKLAESPEDKKRGKGGNYGSYDLGFTPRRSVKKVGHPGKDGKGFSGQLTSNQFISDRL